MIRVENPSTMEWYEGTMRQVTSGLRLNDLMCVMYDLKILPLQRLTQIILEILNPLIRLSMSQKKNSTSPPLYVQLLQNHENKKTIDPLVSIWMM